VVVVVVVLDELVGTVDVVDVVELVELVGTVVVVDVVELVELVGTVVDVVELVGTVVDVVELVGTVELVGVELVVVVDVGTETSSLDVGATLLVVVVRTIPASQLMSTSPGSSVVVTTRPVIGFASESEVSVARSWPVNENPTGKVVRSNTT
jgi:hypothetical protein